MRLVMLLASSVLTAAATKPKHIVFFLIDDYGFADASYKNDMYNGTASPPTPTIDKLAMSGVRLESYYVNKLCSPTRTALLSGRYAYTIGQDDGVIINGQNIDLPLNLNTIADHFSLGGWNTSAYGKWDAGMTTWGSTPVSAMPDALLSHVLDALIAFAALSYTGGFVLSIAY
jgi:arylsulfatase A-like enzyme